MPHPHIARAQSSVLVVVDVQEPFAKAMAERETLTGNVTTLLHIARITEVPVLVTEQTKGKLGPTVPELASVMEELAVYRPIDKDTFSCCGSEEFVQRLYDMGRDTLILTGIEAHVCVQQTALEVMNLGYRVHVVSDAVTSRRDQDRKAAIEKLRHAGAIVSTTEMVSYELLARAGTPEFKASMKYLRWE